MLKHLTYHITIDLKLNFFFFRLIRGADDRASFLNLIKELRLAFEGESVTNKVPRLLLTAAVPASPEAIAAGYDVPEVVKYVDFLNVMTYDFHGHWEGQVGHNSPLFPLETAASHQRKLTVVRSILSQDFCPTFLKKEN
jgi:chitinase